MSCSAIHTSFSLNGKRFEEFGEGDRPVADTELLMLLVACLGILLLYCIACLYAFYHGGKENQKLRFQLFICLIQQHVVGQLDVFCKHYQCPTELFLSIQSITMQDLRYTNTTALKNNLVHVGNRIGIAKCKICRTIHACPCALTVQKLTDALCFGLGSQSTRSRVDSSTAQK